MTYPSPRTKTCPECSQWLGALAGCPVCGWLDLDKLEDQAVGKCQLPKPIIDDNPDTIVTYTEREFRYLNYVKHARLYDGSYPTDSEHEARSS